MSFSILHIHRHLVVTDRGSGLASILGLSFSLTYIYVGIKVLLMGVGVGPCLESSPTGTCTCISSSCI